LENLVMFRGYYQGKRVLVTGHTGFKGAWLSLWLKELGARVTGLSLPAATHPNLHEIVSPFVFDLEVECDIRDLARLRSSIQATNPEIIFHMAAQSLVRRSYIEPIETLLVNAVGTANLLESVKQLGNACAIIVVTSDKCYENREWEYAYREIDPLGGHDVYSMSKAATELVAQSWRKSFFTKDPELGPIATARAGNVIGGGDYAEDRIVPDCIRALKNNQPIPVRSPRAVRPWQHVLECLSGYLWLGAELARQPKGSPLESAFNFGPDPGARQPVQAVVEHVLNVWPGAWVDASDPEQPHEARLLTLATDKAATLLQWSPCWDFATGVRHTVQWYRERHMERNADMLALSRAQINAYVRDARAKGLAWALDF
jgi:CDP-glucose 4,6-dehydratase